MSAEAYGIKLLLQSKNPLLFTKQEKNRFGTLLSQMEHFKTVICSEESKRQISRLYQYVHMKAYSQGQFVYHQSEIENHLFVVLQGNIAFFTKRPKSSMALLTTAPPPATTITPTTISPTKRSDKNRVDLRDHILRSSKDEYIPNLEDEELLSSDSNYLHQYFEGSKCLFQKQCEFQPGQSFGSFTPFRIGTLVSTVDSKLLVIPLKKYEAFFQYEVHRYHFINSTLASALVRISSEFSNSNSDEAQETHNNNNSTHSQSFLQLHKSNAHQNQTSPPNASIQHSNLLEDFNLNFDQDNQHKKPIGLQTLLDVSSGKPLDDDNNNNKFNNSESDEQYQHELLASRLEDLFQKSDISVHFELITPEAKSLLYKEGDSIDYFYLIESGNIYLRKFGLEGNLKSYTNGDFLGFEDDSGKRAYSCHCNLPERQKTHLRLLGENQNGGGGGGDAGEVVEKGIKIYRIDRHKLEMQFNNLDLLGFFKSISRETKKSFAAIIRDSKQSDLKVGILKRVKTMSTLSLRKQDIRSKVASELLNLMQASMQGMKAKNQLEIKKQMGLPLPSPTDQATSHPPRVRFNLGDQPQQNPKELGDSSERNTHKESKHEQQQFVKSQSMKHMHLTMMNSLRQVYHQQQQDESKNEIKALPQRVVNLSFIKFEKPASEQPSNILSSSIYQDNKYMSPIKLQDLNSIRYGSSIRDSQKKYENTNRRASLGSNQFIHTPSTIIKDLKYHQKEFPNIEPITQRHRNNNNNNNTPADRIQPQSSSNRNIRLLNRFESPQHGSVRSVSQQNSVNKYPDSFSQIYHKKKHIIQIQGLNEVVPQSINKHRSRQSAHDSHNLITHLDEHDEEFKLQLTNQFEQDQSESLPSEKQPLQKQHINPYEATLSKQIERQVLNIPKLFQDKLWGSQKLSNRKL